MGYIYIRCGSQAWTRHIDISKQDMPFGDKIGEGLLKLHNFFGCDSVNAFGDEENVPVFNLIIKDKSHLKAKEKLEEDLDLSAELLGCEQQQQLSQMWMSSNTNCLKQRKETWNLVNFLHVQVSYIFMTCMLITLVWKRSLEKYHNIPNLKPGYCGIMENDQLSID